MKATFKNNIDLKKEYEKTTTKQLSTLLDDFVTALKLETPVDTGKARDGWTHNKNSISNSVPYIDDLNKGSSKQAPLHFIEKTLLASSTVKPNGVIVSNS